MLPSSRHQQFLQDSNGLRHCFLLHHLPQFLLLVLILLEHVGNQFLAIVIDCPITFPSTSSNGS